MNSFGVTVELTFSIEAGSEAKAQELAERIADSISGAISQLKTPPWLGVIEVGECQVEED